MKAHQLTFIELARAVNALKFGEFTLKSGRESPYFFNAGAFCSGSSLATIGQCYAAAIVESGVEFDVLMGPAYKGIPLAASVAVALSRDHGLDIPYTYNRKEAKDHGEGGVLVGAPLHGRVLLLRRHLRGADPGRSRDNDESEAVGLRRPAGGPSDQASASRVFTSCSTAVWNGAGSAPYCESQV